VDAGELGESQEQSRVTFEAGEQPVVVVQPSDCPFDFPALTIPFQHAAVLRMVPCLAALAMRTDPLDAVVCKTIAKRIAVGGAVINQPGSMLVRNVIVEQRFDQFYFGGSGTVDIQPQRQPLAIDQQHQLAILAAFRGANAFAPFVAGTNVASAIATSQSIRPLRSSLCSTRRHASSKTPLSIHWASRRQQVVSEGK